MTLRGPAAHLSRTPSGWRRSGDESNWARLRSAEEEQVEVRPHVSRSLRAPRPHSAIERGQRGGWPVENLQGSYFRDPAHDRVPPFNELTTSMPALNKEPTRQGLHSFYNRDFGSSSGSLSQWESSLGSQESLQASAERRGSWERAHIMQAPGKEHTRLSYLTSVKLGWLPIQRRVVVTAAGPGQDQHSTDRSTSQVKLKQPIAPTLQRAPVSTNGFRHLGGEVERSHAGPSVAGLRTWQQAPYLASPAGEQVPEKLTSTRSEGDKLLGWQALKRGWTFNRSSPLGGRSQPTDPLTRNSSDTTGKSPPINTTSTESVQPRTLLQTATGVEQYKPHTPLHRSAAVQPVRPTIPLNRVERSSQPSHAGTGSAVTTLVPQIKTGFSSITITSRKVTRSSSLPISGSSDSTRSDRARASPPLPLDGHSAGSNPNLVTMERKATIVKVMEHSMTSSAPPPGSTNESESRLHDPDPGRLAPDTVVRRRKATIIKVTEHRETYRPADGSASRAGHPDYRHSYTEGLYREDSLWRQRALGPSEHDSTPSGRPLVSPERRSWACETPDTSTSIALGDPESEGHKLHRSTLNLFVGDPPAVEAPPPPEFSPKASGEGWDRPHRPLSCYAGVFRHAEPSQEENTAQPVISRRLSFGLESNIDSGSPVSGFISRHGTSQGTHQTEAEPSGDGSMRGPPLFQTPPLNTSKRPSPSLTLIKSPDPGTQQTPEDILAANAAAIIANIKLQRRLNPVTSSSPQGNTASGARNGEKPHSAQRPGQQRASAVHLHPPHAEFVPLSPDPNRRPVGAVSLQDALEKSRPDFISRSQGRVRELEQRAQARRSEQTALTSEPRSGATLRHKRAGRLHAAHDNLSRARDRAITGRETQLRTQRCHNNLPEVKRRKEAEKKRELYLTNRQRVELFKKKLLDQILQRTND